MDIRDPRFERIMLDAAKWRAQQRADKRATKVVVATLNRAPSAAFFNAPPLASTVYPEMTIPPRSCLERERDSNG
jgi:hypothetical protein